MSRLDTRVRAGSLGKMKWKSPPRLISQGSNDCVQLTAKWEVVQKRGYIPTCPHTPATQSENVLLPAHSTQMA